MRVRGITLRELAIAIVLIGVLAAIAWPLAREVVCASHCAKDSDCQYNLKCIGRAFEMYRQDWGDMYPVAHNLHNDAYTWEPEAYHKDTGEPFWFEAIEPYLRNSDSERRHGSAADVLRCPLDMGSGMSWGQGRDGLYGYWRTRLKEPPYNRSHDLSTSYVWNGTLGWTDLWELSDGKDFRPDSNCHYRTLPEHSGGPSPKSQGAITRPQQRLLCWDWMGAWHRNLAHWKPGYPDRCAVLYCDVHARLVSQHDFDEIAQLPVDEAKTAWWIPIEFPDVSAPSEDAGDSG